MIVEITFGVLCPPISEQLAAQGLHIPSKSECAAIEKARNSYNVLSIKGYLSAAEGQKVQKRIFKAIQKSAEPLP